MNYDTANNFSRKNTESILSASPEFTKTVLLVDDDATLLRGLARIVADEGHNLHMAISAAEANAILARHRVDLVISDNLMSGVLGTEFLAGVRKRYPHIKLMMLSGYMPAAVAQRAIRETGVARILTKPCRTDDMVAAIRDVLADSPAE